MLRPLIKIYKILSHNRSQELSPTKTRYPATVTDLGVKQQC